ncbi:transglutaminase-like domain-containing protein [Streptomyces reniochalinae]|uniref:Transglutaminase family protein n=1 Tax=Streptomyces reniochalinae TaxID=2250578 RepID=A0A367F7P9_9ACTN|nr:transglutaminase family protein [Streptomyces reniochalinae]RCG25745.1 transglutaminase family protein [Streptomyces reniochalinae]
MRLTQVTADESAYLAADEAVDHTHPRVRETAAGLMAGAEGDLAAYARSAYEFVRDTVPHSADVDDWRLTWQASDVLTRRIGICHSKSHALVALLRAEGVPAGFCYQKLDVLHGLVALRLPGSSRWVRQDARGNKPGVDARFSLDREQLAFAAWPEKGECDYPLLYAEPHPVVLRALRQATDRAHLWRLLDVAL